ncbi:MAG: T9SS type A sorting domain-containing protein [Bacteroidota bacterium]|nr:T9SS type A sorting domain-containing protein [Bacteroidota bacterium]
MIVQQWRSPMHAAVRISVIVLLAVVHASGQYDARTIPFYLRPPSEQEGVSFSKPTMWVKAPTYPPGTEKHVSRFQNGLVSPDGFPIANACGGAPYDQTETWIAINPRDPLNIVANSNDMQYNGVNGYRMTAFVTKDGGKTWNRYLLPSNANIGRPAGGGQTNFDPALAFDADGNLYYGYGWARLTQDDGNGDNYVIVCKSTDGGVTWRMLPYVWYYEGQQNPPFNDKWLMDADNDPSSPYKNRVYVTWTHFSRSAPNFIAFSYSTDGGETWEQPPVELAYGSIQSPVPCVGPNGILYVAYRAQSGGRTDAVVRVSTNGGASFQPSRVAQTVLNLGTYNSQNGRYELAQKQNMRISSYPAIAVDRSNGPRRGWVYVVQAGRHQTTQQPGVYLVRSTDRGATWSSSIRVDDNPLNNDVFMPAIAVDPLTGAIGVLYYSSQNAPDNTGADAYLAISRDGGSTWRRFRLTPQTWYFRSPNTVSPQGGSGGNYWGDYTSIAARGGKFYACFWMPDSPNGAMSTNDTYVAIVTLGPRPVENLTVTNTYENPTQAVLRWTNPTTTMLGEPLGAYTLVIYRNGQQIAELPAGTTTYTDTGLSDGAPYTYEIIVRTPDGLESTPVSTSIFTGGALEPKPPTNVIAKPHADGIEVLWTNPREHVDGSYFHDFDRIVFYSNGTPVDSISFPQVQAGQPGRYVLRVPTKQFYWLTLRAVGKRNDRFTYSVPTEAVLAYSGAPLRDLFVSFDRDAADTVVWYGYSTRSSDGTIVPTNPQWTRTNVRALSQPNSITDSPGGNYVPGTSNHLILAPFVVPPTKNTFSFAHIALIRATASHYGAIQYSTDFGRTWRWWGTFNRASVPEWGGNATVQTAPWYWAHRSLAAHVGDTVFVRFVLVAGALGADDGWYLDNIGLTDSVASVETSISQAHPSLELYPQPASDVVSVQLRSDQPAQCTIAVVDVMGRIVSEYVYSEPVSTSITLQLDVSQLPTGVYMLQCRVGNTLLTEKMMIAR